MIKAILFDLDGTLLPMDQDTFVKEYFTTLTKKLYKYGYEPDQLIKNIWNGTNKMIANPGLKSNEQVFIDYFASVYGDKIRKDMVLFDEYYRNEFQEVKKSCGYNQFASEVIKLCKEKGLILALATNPIFPRIATESRVKWAGLNPSDFSLITTYENSCHSKPNLEYYRDILTKLNLKEDECIMVGNDVEEDMVASNLGIKTFLLTDCLINKNNKDLDEYDKGTFNKLIDYINEKTVMH